MQHMIWVWLGATVLFGVLEAVTAGLVSIWFAAGSLVALLMAALGLGLPIQMGVFLAVSALTLALTRPLVKKYQNGKVTPTNADRLPGTDARVTEAIDNERSTGAVYADGKTWSARSADGKCIAVGQMVRIQRMEGVKLFVTELQKTEDAT